MSPNDEQKVLQAFYDRIFQMVTYVPTQAGGQGAGVFDPNTTLVQLATVGSLNLADYANMVTPVNANGSLAASEAFYRLIDIPGGIGATYEPTASSIGQTYKQIVNGANSALKPSASELAAYNRVKAYLFTTQRQTDPVTGNTTTVTMPSEAYRNYKTYQNLYLGAVAAMRQSFLTYDMTKPEDQRKYEAQAPVLQGNVASAWNDWVSLGQKSMVEESLNYLASSNNNIVSNIISDAQQIMRQDAMSPLGQGATSDWYLSYGSPFTWNDASQSAGWLNLSLNSNYLYTSDTSYYQKSEGSAGSSFLGLISWGGGGGSSTSKQSHHMQGNNLSITCDMLTVTIERPWMNDALFKTKGWYESGQPVNWISDGKLDAANASALMPTIPTAFVLVRNVSITANWTEQDSQAITTASSGNGGFSFGPFHAGGSGSSSSSSSSSASTFNGGVLTIPNAQVVAWINQITPASPPQTGP